MPATSLTYWLLGLAVLIVNIAAIYVAWRALFADRSRGRRRCPRCWHNLDYTPGMTCGECGHTAPKESHFYRTRRRYGRAVLAVLVCAGLAAFIFDRANQRGWASMLPTNILILCMPFANDGPGGMLSELERRVASDALTDAELADYIAHCAAGDWLSPAGSAAWEDRYARPLDRLRVQWARTRTTPQDLLVREAQLWPLDPVVDASAAPRWPADQAPYVQIGMREFWPLGTQCRISIGTTDGRTQVFYRLEGFSFSDRLDVPLPRELAQAGEPIELRIDIARRPPDGSSAWEHIGSFDRTVAIAWGPAAKELLESRQSSALDAAIAETFAGEVHLWPQGPSPARFSYDASRTRTRAFDGTAIGVRLELRKGGALARELHLWWRAGTDARAMQSGYEIAFEDLDLLQSLAPPLDDWSLTVTGDPALALRAGAATSCWTGTLPLPLELSNRNGTAPIIGWWNEDRLRAAGIDPDALSPPKPLNDAN